MLDLLIGATLGFIIGIITGITPGIHVNSVNSFALFSLTSTLYNFPVASTVFIVILTLTHTIIDIVPSIFLGAPNEESFLAVLPGHEMLIKGKGYEAVLLSFLGVISAIPLLIFIIPLFIKFIPIVFERLIPYISFILIFISIYTFTRETNILLGFLVFSLSAILGYLSLNLAIKDALLPLLSGLFGGSGLFLSSFHKISIPSQKLINLRNFRVSKKEYFSAFFGAGISSPFFSFLPAIGSGHAATISTEIIPQTRKSFLITIGAINIIVTVLSFVTLYAIGKSRTGSAAVINELLGQISLVNLTTILVSSIIAIIVACLIGLLIARLFATKITSLPYHYLSLGVLIFLTFFVIILSGFFGIVVFVTGTALGIFTIQSNVRRINMMSCLIVPTIIIYLF
ncbi:MAG: tripartite tricarboxylate transporter permease [Candidatus Pacearchaeota archaeon]